MLQYGIREKRNATINRTVHTCGDADPFIRCICNQYFPRESPFPLPSQTEQVKRRADTALSLRNLIVCKHGERISFHQSVLSSETPRLVCARSNTGDLSARGVLNLVSYIARYLNGWAKVSRKNSENDSPERSRNELRIVSFLVLNYFHNDLNSLRLPQRKSVFESNLTPRCLNATLPASRWRLEEGGGEGNKIYVVG